MNQLITKLQHKLDEPGEFTEIALRSYDETIQVIESFPWQAEHDHLLVALTNPSVTIESGTGSYLKLSLYYHEKFVLYFLDPDKKLYSKSFTRLADSYPFIQQFFDKGEIDFEAFRYEITWGKNNSIHFQTQSFTVEANEATWWRFLIRSSWLQFSFLLYFLILSIYLMSKPYHPGMAWVWRSGNVLVIAKVLLSLLLLFVVAGGLNLIFFINYYLHVNQYVLKLSRGNDQFWYGPASSPVIYNKHDIAEVRYKGDSRNGRNPLRNFEIFQIKFHNAEQISIPTVFFKESEMFNKFPGIPITRERGFPWL